MINFTSMGCRKLTYEYENRELRKSETPLKKCKDYYPFGLSFNQQTREDTHPQNYKYNGKELQTDLDLNWTDYGARMYDAAIGRWHVQDVLTVIAPDITPYRFAFNNPIAFIDPDGKYEISVILSKIEKDNLRKQYGKGKKYRQARKTLIENHKQGVRDKIAAAKSILDNNSGVKDTFSAFSGIKERSDAWKNLWTENGKGPIITSNGGLSGTSEGGYTEGKNVSLNPDSNTASGAFTILHEFVHLGDNYRFFAGNDQYDITKGGHPDFNASKQIQVLQGVIDTYLADPDKSEEQKKYIIVAYKEWMQEGKVVKVELGYAFEQEAFGTTITKKNIEQMTKKYLPNK